MFENSHRFAIRKAINKTTLILLLIILIGAFLRFYNLSDLLRFNADQARDAQIVDEMKNGEFPLLGPKAGGTKFNLGPAFYYLEYLSGAIFGFTPSGIALFIPILSTLSIYLFYLLFKKIFTTNVTLILTFLYAISFYAIKYSHFAWNPNAIPFFILAFLLFLKHLLDSKNMRRDFIFLGIIIGIATQLHTTLLILMPLTTMAIIAYAYFKKIKVSFLNISLLISFFILVNLPFIYGNFLDGGKNIQEFFAGASAKTNTQANLGASIIKNTAEATKLFLQGSGYHLTGIEPQKNWLNISKLINSKNIAEILLFATSILLFLAGSYLLFTQKIKRNQKILINNAALAFSTFICLAFLLFIIIGSELNIRFFIIVSFIPYLLLGIIAIYLTKAIESKKIKALIFSIFIIFLTVLNLNMFFKTYNLNNYQASESAYGGISYGELDNLCLNIKNELSRRPGEAQEASIESFSFKKSLEYVCLKKYDVKINSFSQKDVPNNGIFFVITENQNTIKNINNYKKSDNQIKSIQIKRFTLLTVFPVRP